MTAARDGHQNANKREMISKKKIVINSINFFDLSSIIARALDASCIESSYKGFEISTQTYNDMLADYNWYNLN